MRSIFISIIYFACMLFCIGVYAQQTSYTKGAENSVHIWISEHGASNGYLFQAYDFDRMEERGINSGFQGTYKTIEIGEQEYTSENLQAVYRVRWATDFTWLNWSDASISAMTQSYHPTWDETPLSVNEYRKLYGSWFTLVGGANSYLTPEYVEFRDTEGGEILTGWGLPGIEDICQLIGQAPRNSNSVHWDVLNFIGASNNDIPSNHNSQWYGEFNNISGLTLTPLGSREPNQGNLSNSFYAHKLLSKLRLSGGANERSFSFYISGSAFNEKDYHYSQVRYCRTKTDEELGYKMYVNNCTDEIIILQLNEDTEYPELPKGLERGIALKYMNKNTRKVNRKWSEIQEEATEYRNAFSNLPAAPSLTFPECKREGEGSVHIWISEHGASNGYLFQAYDFDRMEERGINSGFQGTYKTIEIGEQEYTSENLQAVYRVRWATNFTWLNWSDASVSAMTQSYHPTWDETPLSVNEYRKLYGSWFTLVSGANSYMTPEFVEFRDKENGNLLTGWGLPGIEDICQLIGQAPRSSNSVHWDVLNFVGASNNDIPSNHNSQWYGEFNNLSGLTLTPLGSREPIQGDLSNSFYAHKLLSKLRLSGGANERSFSFYISGSAFNEKDYHYSQVRYCRTKTDEELGYKIYVNNCDDEILILYPDEETEYPELPVGLERGIALKYFDREARLVDRRWSEIQEEATEYRNAFSNLPAAPSLTFPQCNTADGNIEPDPYERGEEGSVHIWISELGSDGDGVGFLAYDFDKMEERGTNAGFQGTYRTIEIGEYEYTTQNLKAIHRERWGTDFTWLNWIDANIASITSSYHPRYDETPLSINEFRNFYGNWFTLLSSVVSYRNPNLCVFRSEENGVELSGWGLPSSNDMMQMAGQTPRFTNSLNHNLLEFMGAGQSDSPSGHITEWAIYKNVSGLTLTPLGGREPVPGDLVQHIYAHKKLSTLRLQEYTSTFTVGTIGTGYSSYSYQYGQVRYCRAKTDEELGYKMYIDEKSNRVVMLPYEATSDLTELPKGVERGVALRYTNRQHMRILKKWTDIQEEADAIRKTLTGEYTPLPDDNIDNDDYYDQDRDDDDEGDDESGGDDGDDKEIVNEISYAYDLSGNRVKRELLLSASPEIRTATEEPEKEQPVYEILEKQKIIIYPNPTKGELMIEISDYSQENNHSVSITDLNGRTIINQQITGIQTHLNIQERASGVYLMKLNVNGKTSTWKIIKE